MTKPESTFTPAPEGGYAFPQTNEQRYADPIQGVIRPSDIYGPAHPGMSLRDYFAAQALSGLLANWEFMQQHAPAVTTAEAYLYADAMLAARKLKDGGR